MIISKKYFSFFKNPIDILDLICYNIDKIKHRRFYIMIINHYYAPKNCYNAIIKHQAVCAAIKMVHKGVWSEEDIKAFFNKGK